MIRVFVLSMGLALMAATAFAQSPAVEKPPEKPAAAPAATGSSAAPTATPQKAKTQNNAGSDVTRDELTKKLECRKQLLRQEHNKNRTQAAPPPPPKK